MDFFSRNQVQKNLLDIKQDDQQGRYVVAATKIPAGTLIIDEDPIVQGPKCPTVPVCLTCYQPVALESPRCFKCGWPFCSRSCMSSETHEVLECQAFQEAGVQVEPQKFNFGGVEEQYDVIYPLRMLLMRKKDPETWSKCLTLQTHINQYGENLHYSLTEEGAALLQKDMTASQYLRKILHLDVDEKSLTSLYGMFYTNDFSTNLSHNATPPSNENKNGTRMTYLLPSLMNHSCVPNIRIAFDTIENGLKIKIVSTKDIIAGEPIYHSYVDNLDPTLLRQKKLKESKFFICTCKRCKDPTELGSLASAIRCVACKESFCLPKLETECLDANSAWNCEGCGSQIPGAFAVLLLEKSKEEICTLFHSPEDCLVEKAEKMIDKYKQMFYPSHGLLMAIKIKLMTWYGQHPKYNIKDLNSAQLTRKMALCTEVLSFLEKLDYKMSLRRGLAMYELHIPLILLAKLKLAAAKSQTEKDEARGSLQKAVNYLERSLNILKTETTKNLEMELYKEGEKTLINIQDFISKLGK